MTKFIDLTGQRFGLLTVVSRAHKDPGSTTHHLWECKCDCGNTVLVRGPSLRKGITKACGCMKGKRANKKEKSNSKAFIRKQQVVERKKLRDLAGKKFGRLTVISKEGTRRWLCQCDCGNTTICHGASLKNGNTKSCGCFRREQRSTLNGMSHTPTYNSWRCMIYRCTNPKDAKWEYYGGRGVSVCDRWLNYENFLSDMGERPEGKTIDRINPDGNYEPGNCRWLEKQKQNGNRRNSKGKSWVQG